MAKDDSAALMERMTAVLEKLGENTKPYEPAFGDPAYQERLKAEGHFDTFPTPVFQNGREAEARGIPDEIRQKASQLTSGTFIGGKVTVERNDKVVHLKYKSMTVEDRMRQPWKDFSDLVTMIWSEQHPA